MSSRRRPYSKRQPAEDYDRALAALADLRLSQQQLLDSINDQTVLLQILLELVETQDSVVQLLQKWASILDQEPEQQAWQEQLAAIRADPNTTQTGKLNNCTRMLQDATAAEVRFAASLTADAWRQYSIEIVHRLILLLELGVRPNMGQQEDYSSIDAAGPSNFDLVAEIQAVLGTMTEDTVLPNREAWTELEAIFDEYFKLGFLSLLVNPNALVEACATNFVTGEPAAAPPTHWMQVVQRLNPTDQQLHHLKVGMQLHERVEQAWQQRMTPLIEKAVETAPLLQMTQAAPHAPATSDGVLVGAGAATALAADSRRTRSAEPSSAAVAPGIDMPVAGSATGMSAKVAMVTQAVAAAGAEGDTPAAGDIEALLQRAVRDKQLTIVTTAFLVNNTFTKLQGCMALVAAFPFGPVAVGCAQGAVDELKRRTEQHELEPAAQPEVQRATAHEGGRCMRNWAPGRGSDLGQHPGDNNQQQQQQRGRGRRRGHAAHVVQGPQAAGDGGQVDMPQWPTMKDLLRRNAEYHMKQRVAELEARQHAWQALN